MPVGVTRERHGRCDCGNKTGMAPSTTLDWLNRLGIVFNFLAGFMLAPELLGIQRIHRLEKRLENAITKTNKALSSPLERIQGLWVEHRDFVLSSLMLMIVVTSMLGV